MKKIVLFLIVGILYACNSDDASTPNEELAGSWKLVEMSTSLPNTTTTGAEMEWQENYILNSDGSFTKTRDANGAIAEVSGTYTLNDSLSNTILELNYSMQSDIVGSCFSNSREKMILQSISVFSSTWNYCDGPGLKYEKVN